MNKPLIHNGSKIHKVGLSGGWYDDSIALHLQTRRCGKTTRVYICNAAGTLYIDAATMRGCIANALTHVAEDSGAPNALHALNAVTDALTALRVAVEAHKGRPTAPEFFRPTYWEIVTDEHRKLFPAAAIPPTPNVAARDRKPAPAAIVNLWAERLRREEAARIAAAKAIAAEKERARIASALVEQPDGQIAMKV